MNWLCLLFGHKPWRIERTFYIMCSRCSKVRKIDGAPGSLASRMFWY